MKLREEEEYEQNMQTGVLGGKTGTGNHQVWLKIPRTRRKRRSPITASDGAMSNVLTILVLTVD